MPRTAPHTAETKARISVAKLGQSSAGRDEDEMVLAMLQLRDAGKTTREIAQILGRSRNSVSGILFRFDQDNREADESAALHAGHRAA